VAERPRVLLICRTDFQYFRDDGRPVVDPERYDVAVVTDRRYVAGMRDGDYDDLCAYASLTEDGVRAAAALFAAREPLRLVVSASETDVEPAAAIREELDLPGMRPAQAVLFRDKVMMKSAVAAAGLRVPAFAEIGSASDAVLFVKQHGRSVIKPRGGMGSRNTSVVDDEDAVRAVLEGIDDPAGFEVEEFVGGQMYHVDSLVRDGSVRLVSVSRFLTSTLGFTEGIPLVTVMCDASELTERIEEFNQRVVTALGLRDGVGHLELFVAEDGEITFCEIGARAGGAGVIPAVIAAYGGLNLMHAAIRAQLGEPMPAAVPRQRSAGYVLVHRREGEVVEVSDEAEFDEPWITFRQVSVRPGTRTRAAVSSVDAVARFVVVGDDERQVTERLETVRQRFRMTVR
jgi:biotin carboxylase